MLPAYAGMILLRRQHLRRLDGAPRVCGDDPGCRGAHIRGCRVLPAYAGMIRVFHFPEPGLDGAPRVCGDDPLRSPSRMPAHWCSPRMRG